MNPAKHLGRFMVGILTLAASLVVVSCLVFAFHWCIFQTIYSVPVVEILGAIAGIYLLGWGVTKLVDSE